MPAHFNRNEVTRRVDSDVSHFSGLVHSLGQAVSGAFDLSSLASRLTTFLTEQLRLSSCQALAADHSGDQLALVDLVDAAPGLPPLRLELGALHQELRDLIRDFVELDDTASRPITASSASVGIHRAHLRPGDASDGIAKGVVVPITVNGLFLGILWLQRDKQGLVLEELDFALIRLVAMFLAQALAAPSHQREASGPHPVDLSAVPALSAALEEHSGRRPSDLDTLAREWLERFQAVANSAAIELRAEIAPDLGIRSIDVELLGRMGEIFFDAAIRHTSGLGVVLLRLGVTAAGELRFAVGSTDPGLTPIAFEIELDQHFKRPEGEGGTSLAARLQDAGGRVDCALLPGMGAEMVVYLPAEPLTSDRRRARVLVFQPDPEQLCGTIEALSECYDVIGARSDREAMRLAGSAPIGVALLDLGLPEMSGLELARSLRGRSSVAHVPIVFTCVGEPKGVVLRREDLGPDGLVRLPTSREALVARVTAALDAATKRALLEGLARDAESGLLARDAGKEEVIAQLASCRERGGRMSIAVVRIDRFGALRDAGPDRVGDLVAEMGSVLRQNTRASEQCARWSDDSFLIVMPDADGTAATIVAERLRTRLARCRIGEATATVSIGLATSDLLEDDGAITFISQAERAADSLRLTGGDSVVLWPDIPRASAGERHVLVVDDDENVLGALTRFFRNSGKLVVHTAHSISEAMELARATPPELVVLDVCLPDGSGYELLRQLRAGVNPELPVIAFTGDGHAAAPAPENLPAGHGFNAFLQRGARLSHLVREVRRWLH